MTADHRLGHLCKTDGIALITTLMVVALVVTVVVEFSRITVTDTEISKNFSDDRKSLYLAISGVNVIKDFLRLEGLYTKDDNLLEEWANSKTSFESASALLEEGRLEGVIVDECSKIQVNSLLGKGGQFDEVQRAIWERLLKQPIFGLTDEQVNTIIHGVKDWIDPDDEVSGIYGAEDTAYRQKGYRCKNSPLDTIEELLLINGVTKEIYYGDRQREGIHSYFSVHGGPEININTASLPVLKALHNEMTEDIALEMDKFRRDKANRWALTNKLWYRSVWPFGTPLPEKVITESSNAFSVDIKATIQATEKEIRAVIARSDDSVTSVIYWQEL
jgi:general secretion pathway protein K